MSVYKLSQLLDVNLTNEQIVRSFEIGGLYPWNYKRGLNLWTSENREQHYNYVNVILCKWYWPRIYISVKIEKAFLGFFGEPN